MEHFEKGDKVIVNERCHEPGLIGQERIVTMAIPGLIFSVKKDGRSERGIDAEYLTKLN